MKIALFTKINWNTPDGIQDTLVSEPLTSVQPQADAPQEMHSSVKLKWCENHLYLLDSHPAISIYSAAGEYVQKVNIPPIVFDSDQYIVEAFTCDQQGNIYLLERTRIFQPNQTFYILRKINLAGGVVWQQQEAVSGQDSWHLLDAPNDIFVQKLSATGESVRYRIRETDGVLEDPTPLPVATRLFLESATVGYFVNQGSLLKYDFDQQKTTTLTQNLPVNTTYPLQLSASDNQYFAHGLAVFRVDNQGKILWKKDILNIVWHDDLIYLHERSDAPALLSIERTDNAARLAAYLELALPNYLNPSAKIRNWRLIDVADDKLLFYGYDPQSLTRRLIAYHINNEIWAEEDNLANVYIDHFRIQESRTWEIGANEAIYIPVAGQDGLFIFKLFA